MNWLLNEGYQIVVKDYSGKRARNLASSVTDWIEDPQVAGREVGWVQVPGDEYVRPVVRVAVRCRKKTGQWATAVLIATLDCAAVLELAGLAADQAANPTTVLLAYVYASDQRGGGIETANKDDKIRHRDRQTHQETLRSAADGGVVGNVGAQHPGVGTPLVGGCSSAGRALWAKAVGSRAVADQRAGGA